MRLLKILTLLGAVSAAIGAQTAEVERKTNLRNDPSANHTPIAVLLPGDKLSILDNSGAPDYLHVKNEDGKSGFVYKKFVTVAATPPDPPPPPPSGGGSSVGSATGAPSGSGPAGSIDSSWDKPAPKSTPFAGSEGTCKETGDGGDTATNLRKNRVDPLPAVHDVTWSAINSLTWPAKPPTSRLKWTAAQLAKISPFEGSSLRVVAYLSHQVKVESEGSGESTNCHFTQAEDVDWHIYLTQEPNLPISKAVIIETTPRIRAGHTWESTVLQRWVNTDKPVRVSGFLMLDPEHWDVVGTQRGTIWEIHPVMKIEVCPTSSCAEGDWQDLDTVH